MIHSLYDSFISIDRSEFSCPGIHVAARMPGFVPRSRNRMQAFCTKLKWSEMSQ